MQINVVEVQNHQVTGPETKLTFVDGDARYYDALLSPTARRQLLSLLQIEVAIRHEAERLSLVVTDHTAAVSRQGNALVLVTEEIGPIAFQIPKEMIPAIQIDLGKLAALPQRAPKP